MDHTLNDIRAAEQKGREIIEETGKEKDAFLNKARQDSMSEIMAVKKGIDSHKDHVIADERRKIIKAQEELKIRTKKEVSALDEKARKNLSKAEDFIIKKFEEEVKK